MYIGRASVTQEQLALCHMSTIHASDRVAVPFAAVGIPSTYRISISIRRPDLEAVVLCLSQVRGSESIVPIHLSSCVGVEPTCAQQRVARKTSPHKTTSTARQASLNVPPIRPTASTLVSPPSQPAPPVLSKRHEASLYAYPPSKALKMISITGFSNAVYARRRLKEIWVERQGGRGGRESRRGGGAGPPILSSPLPRSPRT